MSCLFLDLPAELQLHTLSFLSLENLLKVKKTCRSLHRLITQEETQLAHQLQLRAVARLQDSANYHFNDWGSISFVEALNRWVNHRGIHSDGTSHNYSMRNFAQTWSNAHTKIRPRDPEVSLTPPEVLTIRQTVRSLADAADVLVKVHVQYHEPDYENIHEWENGLFAGLEPAPKRYFEIEGFVNEMQMVASELHVDDDQLRQMYLDLRFTPSGRLEAKVHPYLDCVSEVQPRYLVTHLLTSTSAGFGGFCHSREINEAFGVPQLPRNGVFAYHTKSEWAQSAVHRAMDEGPNTLMPLEKAAVMEDILIY